MLHVSLHQLDPKLVILPYFIPRGSLALPHFPGLFKNGGYSE